MNWLGKRTYGPIGVDLGARSLKLVQFSADHTRVLDVARYELPAETEKGVTPEERQQQLVRALGEARQNRGFRGREVAVCLSDKELFLQNLRVPKAEGEALQRLVQQEAAGRVPFSIAEAQLDFFEAADIRQGEQTLREVILVACHKPVLERLLAVVDAAGLRPIAVDVEPAALLRNYVKQLRRDEDRKQRTLYVHFGYGKTAVVIAQGEDVLFLKYVEIGGRAFDEAVARHLELSLPDAAALRRTHGDRRADQQDPEVSRSVAEAVRPMVERLANEISLCIRYHSVTFRGQPLVRFVLGGGEASASLLETFGKRFSLTSELSDPFRCFATAPQLSRRGTWDVAAGLAYRTVN